MMEVGLVGTVANCPLRSLFDSEEPKLAVTLARRRLPFPIFRAYPAWRLSSTVTYEENLL